jgi:hypothetical protein
MTQNEMDVDLLKSLSIIDGAVMGTTGNDTLKQVVIDELSWIVDILVARIKGRK